jgi:phosphoribosylformylglycinamidine synthase PurS subunit
LFKAIIKVTLKKKILDPQGKAIESSLLNLGFSSLSSVRTGKNIEMLVGEGNLELARATVQSACEKLLANPVTEEFEYEIMDDNGAVAATFSSQHKLSKESVS